MGEPAFPEIVPGQDGAGVVDAVGSGVTDIQVGDRVWTMLAQHTRPGARRRSWSLLPAGNVTRLPDTASFDVGAALGVPAVTAHCGDLAELVVQRLDAVGRVEQLPQSSQACSQTLAACGYFFPRAIP